MTKILRSYVALLFSFLLLGCSGGSEDSTPETSPSLERIHIVASPVSTRGSSSLMLAKGNTQPFIATGHYGDGSVKDLTSETSWHSSDDRIATLSASGALTARDAGTTTITASHDGIISNTVQVTVTDAVLTAIQVTPPSVSVGKGQTRQLTATATYSDNTTANVTGSVAWLPADITTATVSTTGILTGRIAGSTEVTASLDGVTSNAVQVTVTDAVLTAIQVTPPSVSVGKGQTQQLTATATYSDSTTANVTGSVAWLSDDTAAATVISGLLTGVEEGTTEISASLDGVTSNAVQVSVTDAVLTAIEITPPSVSVGKGQTQQLTATATYSDNTTANVTGSVAWLSDDTATATVISGLLTGVEQGTTEVTASLDGVTSNTAQVTVTDAVLTAIEITPSSVSVGKGQTQQLTATATYSDNTTANVTGSVAWLSDDAATATVISGLLTGVEEGTTEISASLDGVTSDRVTVNVVVTPLFGEFEDISVNDFTFAVDAGFPTTGFHGAEFTLNTPSAPSEYTWSSDVEWVSVDNGGNVRITSEDHSAPVRMLTPVTITAVPTSGGAPLTYTFALRHWFFVHTYSQYPYESSGTTASWWCDSRDRNSRIPPVSEVSLGLRIRQVGSLFSEWGAADYFIVNDYSMGSMYWAYATSSYGRRPHVRMSDGYIGESTATLSNRVMCRVAIYY
ncbi:Ig-like domain-containing protein [Aeromonas caviae]|uniref:Ig-like domain-containing protein n=1 Tax=Aeromonas caviae TaxID=648 RepID=UPI003EC69044